MTIETPKTHVANRIALLYKDLLSRNLKPLTETDKTLLLSIKPINKIVAIGDVDLSNWNAYALTYLLDKKLVAPVVLDESKIYQSIQAMRTHNEKVIHPQMLISQSVVIRIVGLDNSANINDYINSFISSCVASDECKIIFVIFDCDKKYYKNNVYIRKSNSTFIETSTGKPYVVESSPLCITPEQITFFNFNKKPTARSTSTRSSNTTCKTNCKAIFSDPDMF